MSNKVPEGWRYTTLGAVADLISGQHIPADQYSQSSTGTPYLTGPSDFPGGRIRSSNFTHSPKVMCGAGDILITVKGSGVGKLCVADRPYCISRQLSAVRPINVESTFLLHALSFNAGNIANGATGFIPGIARDHILGLSLYLPTLPEQRRIAEILSSVDETIQAAQAVIGQARKVKQGILKHLLTKGIGHTRFKHTEIGNVPETWQVIPLSDACSSISVGIASSATHAYCEVGVPLLRNQNIKAGYLDLDDLLFVSEEYDQSYASKRIRAGDVITMRTGYPGRSAVVPPQLEGSQTFTTLISRPKVNVILPEFLCEWINSDAGMLEVKKRQAGGAQQNLNAGVLKSLPVPLPPLSEQRRIAEILAAFPREETEHLEKLQILKQALTSDLLTGRRRVPIDNLVAAE